MKLFLDGLVKLGMKFSTPIFDGASLDDINKYTMMRVSLEMVEPTYLTEVLVKGLINLQQWGLFTC